MKKVITLLALSLPLLSNVANARDGFYLGTAYAKMGYTGVNLNSVKLNGSRTENGHNFTVGYDFAFARFFSLDTEFEYKDLGGVNGDVVSGGTLAGQVGVSSYGFNIMPRFYIGRKFSLYPKFGFHKFVIDERVTGTANNKSVNQARSVKERSAFLGIGFGFDFTEHIALHNTYEFTSTNAGIIGAANIGLRFTF